MHLHQLHAYLAVAEDLSFRRAAARLHFSQAGLSAQIAALEAHLGVRLFQRDRLGTTLTDDGLALLPLARTAVAAAAQVEQAARHRPRIDASVTVGILADGIGWLTWPVLHTFFTAHPDVALRVVRVGFDDAVPRLTAGGIDALFAIGPFGEEDGVATTVGSLPLAALMPHHHPRAEDPVADPVWLAEHLTVKAPDPMGRTWVSFWSFQDLGGPPLDRLRLLPHGTSIAEMANLVRSSGVIGAWPSELPTPSGTAARALAIERRVPRQVLLRHGATPAARQLAEIARRLSDTHLEDL